MDTRTRLLTQWIDAPTDAAATEAVIALAQERQAQRAERYVPESLTWGTAPEYEPMPPAWAEEPAWMAEAMEVHHG